MSADLAVCFEALAKLGVIFALCTACVINTGAYLPIVLSVYCSLISNTGCWRYHRMRGKTSTLVDVGIVSCWKHISSTCLAWQECAAVLDIDCILAVCFYSRKR